jgi:glycosyltransferase involved in cell wall biosynthesis
MNPLVSIIVPVYNVEAYLERCLDSLCKQSLKEIEVILVDDASPDNSGEICERYAEKDKRIVVYHQPKNKGLSAARNIGIKHASGEYLMFVDSDDWVDEDFCKTAYECAVQFKADLVMFNYACVKSSASDAEPRKVFRGYTEGVKSREEAMGIMLDDGGNAAWNKMYKKNLFEDVIYPEGFLYEDTGTTYKLVYNAKNVYFLDKILYYQYIRPNSITTSKVTNKVLRDRAILNTKRYQDLISWGYNSEQLEYRFLNFALWYCTKAKLDLSDSYSEYISQYIHSCKRCPNRFSLKMKIIFYIFKYCPFLFKLIFVFKK